MGKILAVCNQKGGVGKTTTSLNLSASLVALGKQVLLVDLDPQGNATMGSGIDKNHVPKSMYDVLTELVPFDRCVLATQSNYDLLPANVDLTAAEVELLASKQREYRLKKILHPIRDQYDFIVIDCPPALGILTINALAAADAVVIPIQCEYYALEGLAALLATVEKIKAVVNSTLEIDGLLRTMFDARNSLSNDVSHQLLLRFPKQIYRTIIPRNVRLAEAPSHGISALSYDKKSKGALAYLALAGEIVSRNKKLSPKQVPSVSSDETVATV